jgi:hypothetical protein
MVPSHLYLAVYRQGANAERIRSTNARPNSFSLVPPDFSILPQGSVPIEAAARGPKVLITSADMLGRG